MPEFVACPACGCRLQMADSMIGRTVRCISCDHRFTALSPAEAPTQRVKPLPANAPAPHPSLPPRVGEGQGGGPPPLPPGFDAPAPFLRRPAGEPDDDRPPGAGLPRCPTCARPVAWQALRCASCGQALEIDPERFRRGQMRRDCEPHRGGLLAGMGNLTLVAGGLTLCVLGLPVLIAVPLGITTWVMASSDLAKMRTGEMEVEGRPQTENARTSAITGMILSVFFAAGWGVLVMNRMFPW